MAAHPVHPTVLAEAAASMRLGRRVTVPQHAHPLVRRLFAEMRRQRASAAVVAARAGISERTLKGWRHHAPTLQNLDAALNVLGLKLDIASTGDTENG